MSNKVYIIVPAYNVDKYIVKCIESILNQTYECFELLLVDDGSTDQTPFICDTYQKKDRRIKVIHKENGGLSSARNAGLYYLRNKSDAFITFIDGDDWVDNDFIESMVKSINHYQVDIVCQSFVYGEDTLHSHKNADCDLILNKLDATRLLLLDKTIQSHIPTKMYKIELWKNYTFDENIKYMEDQNITYKLFYESEMIFVSNVAKYHYRQDNPNSLTKKTVDNTKVVCGLMSYFSPCNYDFKEEDRKMLLGAIHSSLFAAYLTLIPHFKKKKATALEIGFIKHLQNYIKINKIYKCFISGSKNEKIKKMLFIICPSLYPYLFKISKKIMKLLQ